MSRFDLIIFDCDGTLVDSERLLVKAFSDVSQEMGFEKLDFDTCLSTFIGKTYEEIDREINKIIPNFPFREVLEKYNQRSYDLIPEHLDAIPNAEELLISLGNRPKCVASNGFKHIVEYSLQITGLDKYFNQDHVYTFELVQSPKPEPDLFLYAAKEFSAKPQNCLVIEDSVFGVKAGVAAGMVTVAYVPNGDKQKMLDLGASHVITNLMEISDLA